MKSKSLLLMGLTIGLLIYSSISFAEVDKWTKKADMPTGRGYLSTSAVNGKIYAIGGMKNENNVGVVLRAVEAYDPALDKWTTKTDMPTARCYMTACTVNGKIYVIGGINSNTWLSTVEEYDTGFTGESVEAQGKLATSWGEIKK